MSHDQADNAVRRVLVAMDASPYGLAAAEAAVRLAAELHADLLGLFVEDADLLRMAELPVVREVALSSALARAMDPAAMERLLRAKADEARRALAQAAERSSVTWSFQVARGHVVRASLDSANEVDLLVLGKDNAAPKPSPLRAQRALAVAGPLLLVYDGMPGSESALDTALQLAVANDDELMVVAVTSREHSWAELSEVVSSRMEAADVEGTIQARTLSDVAELVAEVRSRRAKLVLVSRRSPLLDAAAMEFLVNELDCPLALV